MQKDLKIAASARVGRVRLTVGNLFLMSSFYQDVIGLSVIRQESHSVVLGVDDDVILELIAMPSGELVANRPGLFHLAILLPDRTHLAAWFRHLLESGHQLSGAADHLVSEALYLADPEGNGIEIYADRPRGEWRHESGRIKMATNRLDLQALFNDAGKEAWEGRLPVSSSLGHVHLQVNDLAAGLHFYESVLGLEHMTSYPGAEFLAAGGYHHHVGINTWNSAGSEKRSEELLGLKSFSLLLPDEGEIKQIIDRATGNGFDISTSDDVPVLSDPSGNNITLEIDR